MAYVVFSMQGISQISNTTLGNGRLVTQDRVLLGCVCTWYRVAASGCVTCSHLSEVSITDRVPSLEKCVTLVLSHFAQTGGSQNSLSLSLSVFRSPEYLTGSDAGVEGEGESCNVEDWECGRWKWRGIVMATKLSFHCERNDHAFVAPFWTTVGTVTTKVVLKNAHLRKINRIHPFCVEKNGKNIPFWAIETKPATWLFCFVLP